MFQLLTHPDDYTFFKQRNCRSERKANTGRGEKVSCSLIASEIFSRRAYTQKYDFQRSSVQHENVSRCDKDNIKIVFASNKNISFF